MILKSNGVCLRMYIAVVNVGAIRRAELYKQAFHKMQMLTVKEIVPIKVFIKHKFRSDIFNISIPYNLWGFIKLITEHFIMLLRYRRRV